MMNVEQETLNTEVSFDYKTLAWGIEALFELFFMKRSAIKKASAESPTQLNLTLFSIYYKCAVQLGQAQIKNLLTFANRSFLYILCSMFYVLLLLN